LATRPGERDRGVTDVPVAKALDVGDDARLAVRFAGVLLQHAGAPAGGEDRRLRPVDLDGLLGQLGCGEAIGRRRQQQA
jgi:hypothetical protein